MRLVRVGLIASAGVILGLSAGQSVTSPSPVAAADGVALQLVTGGVTSPVGVTHAGDSRLFIVQQNGLVRIWNGASLEPTPFLDVSSLIPASPGFEEGLLGLAFHPDYPADGRFFIHYVNGAGNIVIAQYTVSGDPDVADAGSAVILKTIAHPTNNNHNGGQLAFGPDGMLYVGIGDGGGGGDVPNNAQNIHTLLGKILRLNVDVPAPYIPADNPFFPTGLKEIWAYGLRNPWRFSFDRVTGDLFIGDVGQIAWEEVDFQPASSNGGENYGWRVMEGAHCYNPPSACYTTGKVLPILEYPHGAGDCSITGGYRYRGPVAGFEGVYVYGDFCSGRIWGATKTGANWSSALLLDSSAGISTFGEDVNGNLYVADLLGNSVYQLNVLNSDGDAVVDFLDNCTNTSNPFQFNNDGNFIDQTPPRSVDDTTLVNSDGLGDACDSDNDNDGLTDVAETAGAPCGSATGATNPLVADTDGDLMYDGAECALGSNPNDAGSVPAIPPPANDPDGDRLSTAFESSLGTNPNDFDSDDDGLRDGTEYKNLGSNPLLTQSDEDTVRDDCEVTSLNTDTKTNPGDQALLASEMLRIPPPPKLVNYDINRDSVLNPGDQAFQSSRALPGVC